MGKLILISGSNDSGKSLYAEKLISNTTGERFYLATMKPVTEDNWERIEKHRQQRRDLGFITLECPYQVGNLPKLRDGVVLLEDISNLLANVIFDKNGTVEEVFADVRSLLNHCRILVAVTISGLESAEYDAETAIYIDGLNEVNQRLFELADVAIVMQDGKPQYQKGEDYVTA